MFREAIKQLLPGSAIALWRASRDSFRLRSIGVEPMIGSNCTYLGTPYGGYAVPIDALDPQSVCLCFGAGEDISFEIELARRFACTVDVLDPTPRSIRYVRDTVEGLASSEAALASLLRFHPWGIWSEDTTLRFYAPTSSEHVSHSIVNMQGTKEYFEAECVCPKTLLTTLGATSVDLIKLNIEGAEYEVLAAFEAAEIHPRIICLNFDEMHSPIDRFARYRMREQMEKLTALGYRVVNADTAKITLERAR